MKFSDDRIAYLSHLIRDGLKKDNLVVYPDEDKALREIKRTLIEYLKVEEEADQAARDKIGTLKRTVVEGSPEWDILHRKYFEEELSKRGRG